MHRSHRSVTGAPWVCLALAACSVVDGYPAGAITTEAVRHMETENALAAADLGPRAIEYVREHEPDLGGSFEIISETRAAGLRHVRLQQSYGGVPVQSSIVIAHADDITFLGYNGFVTRNLDGFDVTPMVSADQALATAKADHAGSMYTAEASTLVILPGSRGARLAWRVSFTSQAGRWRYFIDARDGTVLRRLDNRQTLLQASGRGGNPAHARQWEAELDVEEDDGELVMDTDRLKTVDASDDNQVVKGTDVEDMPDPVANDAHGYAEITLAMMRDWMGRDSLDDDGYKIEARVHGDDVCGFGPDNACWDGEHVNFGLGGGEHYEWAGALDAVGHELNHGFTEFHSELEYEGESGGLNESFSDVAGTIAEFYEEGEDADFDIFEDISSGEPLRYLCDPTRDGISVGDAGDLYDDIDVHYSSGVGNRAFCLAVGRTKAALGASTVEAVETVGHVWYAANAGYWTSGTTFADACRGTVDAARAVGLPGDVVEGIGHSWADVGAACETGTSVCDGDDDCDAAGGETCASCPEDCDACSEDCSAWDRARCALGIADCSRCDAEPGCGDHVCSGDETDANCPQDCGCAALDCEDLAPFGCYCDDACEDIGDCCADRGDSCG
jgi:vibriolysin